MTYTAQLLCGMGDITIGWSDDQVAMMTEIIQKKMDEGYVFFIKESADSDREVRLKKIDDLVGRNAVIIGDKDAERLIKEGQIGIVTLSSGTAPITTTRRAKTAKEAATNNTVATQKVGGG